MMEQSKKSSLMVARSILNNKLISQKLERYLKVRGVPRVGGVRWGVPRVGASDGGYRGVMGGQAGSWGPDGVMGA